ncbi:hypothetical protein BC936DRAFT_142122 [Jimgerdemannia flammicorona]|uniref:Uncharacterized protein n=2 Tax=Jimgerdemannia flammicorona TaxID=994334 RepID=A0A433DFE8_9FUNG|nr:hypothetical protein BC936DRAFT_142122 [Jimgerdemannia flammicorona]RUS31138.1 hypothetical protein BC938DRAFT_478396 [Jimgerdemannia flammicorona]
MQPKSPVPTRLGQSPVNDVSLPPVRDTIIDRYLLSPILQGCAIGFFTLALSVVAVVFASFQTMVGGDVIWDIRIGLFLATSTVITRVMSVMAGLMTPAILAGALATWQVNALDGSAPAIYTLMEAAMIRSPLNILKACVATGRTRKLALVIALVVGWQFILITADLYMHASAVGQTIRLPGTVVGSRRALEVASNCSESSSANTCGMWLSAVGGGMVNPARALQIYRNTSDSLCLWRSGGRVYLLQAPPTEPAYAYSGSAISLQPSCRPISSICGLGADTHYTCPASLWSADGNTQKVVGDVNITSTTYNADAHKYLVRNPVEVIVTVRYSRSPFVTEYDSEFVEDTYGDLFILLHCQLQLALVEYNVTLGVLETKPLGHLTDPQLLALGGASVQMVRRAIDDVEDVAHLGDSKAFSKAFAEQFAQATLAAFSGAVQSNGEGYNYTREVTLEQSAVPLHALFFYIFVHLVPLLPFWILTLLAPLKRTISHYKGMRCSWLLAEWLCTPQRLFHQAVVAASDNSQDDNVYTRHLNDANLASLSAQRRSLETITCQIGPQQKSTKRRFVLTVQSDY